MDGPVASAQLVSPGKIALDYNNGLLIFDYDRIRRLDLNAMTLSTFIGGGTQTADGVAPLTVQFSPIVGGASYRVGYSVPLQSGYTSQGMPLIPLPNGDLIFQSESSDNGTVQPMRYRWYRASQGVVTSITPSGTGDYSFPTENIQTCTSPAYGSTWPCVLMGFGVAFNPATSAFTTLMVDVAHLNSGGETGSDTTLDPNPANPTFAQSLSSPLGYPKPYGYNTVSDKITGRDGALYMVNRYQPLVQKYNAATNTWVPIAGTGSVGSCPDGTAATSCNMDILDVFVDAQSHIYIMDAGRLRAVDENGNLVTIIGQPFFFGDGQLALSARFNTIATIDQSNDGNVYLLDPKEFRLRKFQIGGNIQTIAGNGSNGAPNTTAPATNQPIQTALDGEYWDTFVVDPTTDNVYMSQGSTNISKLSPATGVWSTVNNSVPSSVYPIGLYGFDGQNTLTYTYVYEAATNTWDNSFLTLFPAAGGSGAPLVGSATALVANAFCTAGTSASNCMIPVYGAETRATFDSANSRGRCLALTLPISCRSQLERSALADRCNRSLRFPGTRWPLLTNLRGPRLCITAR